MKKTKTYCDYCGKEITNKNDIRNIQTIWKQIWCFIGVNPMFVIGGDGCIDCYKSYEKWCNSREKLKEWNR